MALIQKYTCDKCGHEQPTDEQMWILGVGYRSVRKYGGYGANDWSSREQMWCRRCLEDVGLVPIAHKRIDPPAPPPPTFEDLVRQIADDVVREATGAST